ncbi:MAG: FAD-dependent monooxygenase [Bacteroidota bacterium]
MKIQVGIIGGGPAGAAAARYLATQGISTALIDRTAPGQYKIGEGLVPGAKVLLQDLKIWDRFSQAGHLPSYGNESAWGSIETYGTDFIRSPYGHGWHLDRAAFDELLQEMARKAGAEVLKAHQLMDFKRVGGQWQLKIKHGGSYREMTCDYLMDATGRSHYVARKLKVERHYEDQLIAFYRRYKARQKGDEDGQSFIESVRDGWWYTALLPDGHRVVVFFTDRQLPLVAQVQQAAGFQELMQQSHHLKEKMAAFDYEAIEAPKGTDARTSRLQHFYGEAWLACASMAFPPFSPA